MPELSSTNCFDRTYFDNPSHANGAHWSEVNPTERYGPFLSLSCPWGVHSDLLDNGFFWLSWQPSVTIWSQRSPLSQRRREEFTVTGKKSKEGGSCRDRHEQFQFLHYLKNIKQIEHLLFVKLVCVAGRYFKEEIKYLLSLIHSRGKYYLVLRGTISIWCWYFIVKCFTL